MAVAHRFGQRIGNAGPHADHGGLFDAELLGNQVRRPKPDAANVTRQPVGFSLMTCTASVP